MRLTSTIALLATAAVATTYANDAAAAADAADSCMAPAAAQQLESKIQQLEASNAQWSARLDTATTEWLDEKAQLEAKVTKEQADHRSTALLLQTARREAQEQLSALEKKVEEADAAHATQLSELQAKVQVLSKTVDTLKAQLATEQEAVSKKDSQVVEAREKLRKYADQIKTLEKDVLKSQQKNEALRLELDTMDEKLTFASLLSSYYDEGVVVAGNVAQHLRTRLLQAQDGTSGVNQAIQKLHQTTQQVREHTDKLYAQHLAAHVDPVLAQVHTAAQPHINKYMPIVHREAAKAKKHTRAAIGVAHQRAREARLQAIRAVEQHEQMAPHASRIVDASIFVLAAPIVYMAFFLALRLVWWALTTTVCVATCGCCCGRSKARATKLKRKLSRKNLTTVATATTASSNKKGSSPAAPAASVNSASRRPSGSKKGKK